KIRSNRQLFALLDQPVCNGYWDFGGVANVLLDRTELDLYRPDRFFLWSRNGALHFGLGGFVARPGHRCGFGCGRVVVRWSKSGLNRCGLDGWAVGAALGSGCGLG